MTILWIIIIITVVLTKLDKYLITRSGEAGALWAAVEPIYVEIDSMRHCLDRIGILVLCY